MTPRPNILFLMTDEQRFDVAGFAGNSVVRTPNLDALARDAVVFDNAYEGSVRVPLFIRYPRAFGAGRRGENVSLCDLYATLCELCGVPTPDGLDSRSLMPLLRGEVGVAWDNEVVSEVGLQNVMIKRDDLKYSWRGAARSSLRSGHDPGEESNLADDAQYVGAMEGFRARLEELGHGAGG